MRNQAAMLMTYLEIRSKRGYAVNDTLDELLAHGSYRMGDRHQALIAMAGMG